MSKIEVGDIFKTNEGGEVIVTEYLDAKNVWVAFNDSHRFEKKVEASQLRRGTIKNPYHPSVKGMGFIGVGTHKVSENNKSKEEYHVWYGMLERVYCSKFHKKCPTYIGCRLYDEWHNFQNFAEWFDNQRREKGWDLDKDIILRGNKLYSPETCRFIPQEINKLLTDSKAARGAYPQGVCESGEKFRAQLLINGTKTHIGYFETFEDAFKAYKEVKEKNIQRMAEEYRTLLDPLVYESLLNYEVEP